MASTSTEENAPQVEKMMEEISAGMETVRLEQRLDSLKDVDRKIGDLMIIVTEVMSSLDKDKPISKAKMEDLYKKYEAKLDEVQRGIAEQLAYLEQVCVGAEHQGSTFHSKQVAELSAKRLLSLCNQLVQIRDQCWGTEEGMDGAAKAEAEEQRMEQ